ncbi:MAG TPA: hypothetical protein VLI06_17105, partial [Solimonas sp.]|nr:hypothetical protein [Solimonas sp.]
MGAVEPRMHVYMWEHCFLLQAHDYELDRRHNPYHRLSVTLLLAHEGSFELGVNGEPVRECEAVLLPSNIQRDWITSRGRPLTILDAGISSAAYLRLAPYVSAGQPLPLAPAMLGRLRALLAPRAVGSLEVEAA